MLRQLSPLSLAFALTSCMAFQDVELSTDRANVSTTTGGSTDCRMAGEGKISCGAFEQARQCVGGKWRDLEKCSNGLVCAESLGCVPCKPRATPPPMRCADNAPQTCDATGHWVSAQSCDATPDTPICNTFTAQCAICQETEAHCNPDGMGYQQCTHGVYSTTVKCTQAWEGVYCVDPPDAPQAYCALCVNGTSRCSGNVVMRCKNHRYEPEKECTECVYDGESASCAEASP